MAHQSGITNRPPDHALFASFTLTAGDPDAARTAVEGLRSVVKRELRSELDNTHPGSDKATPSDETGELGFDSGYDRYRLTITVGFSKSGFDKLGIEPENQPQDLIPIPWSQLSDTPQVDANGGIFVQVCSESTYVNEHVVRRIEEELGEELQLTWLVAGSQRHTSRSGRVNRQEGRALIGFLDGTSNLNPRRSDAERELVFVDPTKVPSYPPQVPLTPPGNDNPYTPGQPAPVFPPDLRTPPTREPDWTVDGTYAVVRASVIDIASWDDVTLGEQEHIVGRFKVSGSGLDRADNPSQDPIEPDFSADPTGQVTALASHIRKSNPRGPDDTARRIFRRGYPLIDADVTQFNRGLVFVAFARTITTQFEFITRAWTANADFPAPGTGIDLLRRFETVLCGGYFFVPPLQRANEPWSWQLPA
jgi:deferrochelatase/peroxidase EfeB